MTPEPPRRPPARTDGGDVKVLFVAGVHRAGSTILADILDQIDGFFTIGELVSLGRALSQDTICGCGAELSRCEMWKSILVEAFGDKEEATARLQPEGWWLVTRNVPQLLLRGRLGDRRLDGYREALGTVCRAIQAHVGARVIVDASKRPAFGVLLDSAPGIDLYTVHLVRDPRATFYSWLRAEHWNVGPLTFGAIWSVWHSVIALQWRRRRHRYLLLRYEDFVRRPREAIREIVALVGETADDLPFVDEHAVLLSASHTMWGNPNRFRRGPVPIEFDDEWRTRLGGRAELAAMASSWPLRRSWGYRFRT